MSELWGSRMKKLEKVQLDSAAKSRDCFGMSKADTIRVKLEAAFAPQSLRVDDVSAAHQGHAGHRHGGETHFTLHIVAAAFTGLSRLARQRLVYQVLDEDLKGGVHSVVMTTLAPGE